MKVEKMNVAKYKSACEKWQLAPKQGLARILLYKPPFSKPELFIRVGDGLYRLKPDA